MEGGDYTLIHVRVVGRMLAARAYNPEPRRLVRSWSVHSITAYDEVRIWSSRHWEGCKIHRRKSERIAYVQHR